LRRGSATAPSAGTRPTGRGADSFDDRVVARRRDDVGKRMEKVDVPDLSRA
jgi:hypothetical protein